MPSPYRSVVGILSPPTYSDCSVQHFLELAPKSVNVMQNIVHANWWCPYKGEASKGSEQNPWKENMSEMWIAGGYLAEACDVVAQVGTNWAWAAEVTPDDLRARCKEQSEIWSSTFIMSGLAILDALRFLGLSKVAVANAYYRDRWVPRINDFIRSDGIEIVHSGNFISTGTHQDLEEMTRVEAENDWNYPFKSVFHHVTQIAANAPDAEAIVITGAGIRSVGILDALEGVAGRPVIPSDSALYWATLKSQNLRCEMRRHGTLLSTLG